MEAEGRAPLLLSIVPLVLVAGEGHRSVVPGDGESVGAVAV
jgi:hypothetical protein